MSAFISWSGSNSATAGAAFHQLLRHVLQGLSIFISSDKIRSGQLWFPEIQRGLESAKYGVVIASQEAVQSPWVLFEAGAIWKAQPEISIGVLLVGLTPDSLRDHPLGQFQARRCIKEEVHRLVLDIRNACGLVVEDEVVARAFEQNWPEFDRIVAALPEEAARPGLAPISEDERLDQIGDRLSSIEEFIIARSETDKRLFSLIDRVLEPPRALPSANAFNSLGIGALGSHARRGLLSRALEDSKPLVSGTVAEGEGPTATSVLVPKMVQKKRPKPNGDTEA